MDRMQPLPSQSARPGAGGGAVSTHLLQCDGSIETGKEWELFKSCIRIKIILKTHQKNTLRMDDKKVLLKTLVNETCLFIWLA